MNESISQSLNQYLNKCRYNTYPFVAWHFTYSTVGQKLQGWFTYWEPWRPAYLQWYKPKGRRSPRSWPQCLSVTSSHNSQSNACMIPSSSVPWRIARSVGVVELQQGSTAVAAVIGFATGAPAKTLTAQNTRCKSQFCDILNSIKQQEC